MINYNIDTELTRYIHSLPVFNTLTENDHIRLYSEICNATLHKKDSVILNKAINKDVIPGNPVNSLLMYIAGIYTDPPNDHIAIKSFGSYPDIDVDYSKNGRDKAIEYTKEKFGHERVSQVATFGTLGAKGSIRSAARALGYTVAEGDYIAKLISNEPDITISSAIDGNPTLQEIINSKEEPYFHIIDVAKKLEGLPNATGIHASALVISDRPIYEYMPLMVSKKDGAAIATQYEYYDVESNMLIKLDYLGLKTLDVISETIKLVKKYKGIDIDLDDIDVNDPSIYKLLNDGHNTLIFQFESSQFKAAVDKSNPQSIHDLSAISALLRPGSLSNGMFDQYIIAKNTGQLYDYGLKDDKLIAKVQEICSNCYSVMAYQEYVIKCFTDIAGLSELEADDARRGLGKKLADVLEALGKQFVSGGVKNGYSKECLLKLFHMIEKYSGYSFNASHRLVWPIMVTW